MLVFISSLEFMIVGWNFLINKQNLKIELYENRF